MLSRTKGKLNMNEALKMWPSVAEVGEVELYVNESLLGRGMTLMIES